MRLFELISDPFQLALEFSSLALESFNLLLQLGNHLELLLLLLLVSRWLLLLLALLLDLLG